MKQEELTIYLKNMEKLYSLESHKNQLIQECSELIKNLSKQKQIELNNGYKSCDLLINFPIELLHVKLIIDYFIFLYPHFIKSMNVEFYRLCEIHKIDLNINIDDNFLNPNSKNFDPDYLAHEC